MNAQSKFTNFKKFGLVLAAVAFVSFAGDASAQNRNGRSGHFSIVVTHGSTPTSFGSSFRQQQQVPSFRHQQRQGPFASMPRRQRAAIRWLADKRPQWHVRMSNQYPRRYDNRVEPLLRSLPARWQNRMHNQNSRWYHANVGRGHRLVTNNTGHGRNGGQNTGHGGGNSNQHGGQVVNHTGGNTGHSAGSNGCGLNVGTAIGAALGGFAGSQFGSGSGTLAATAAGTFLGAIFGSSAGCR